MARSEARLFNEIWKDEDFLALPVGPQRAYMFLLSQDDLAHDGVIALRLKRWAGKAAGLTPGEFERDLEALERDRFLVIDWDTEEVLVRSLIRRDKIYRQPNVMRAAIDHIPLIESPRILAALAAEVARIRSENPDLTATQNAALTAMESALAGRVPAEQADSAVRPTGNPTVKGYGKGSDIPSANPSDESTSVDVSEPFTNSPLRIVRSGIGEEGPAGGNPSPNPSGKATAKGPRGTGSGTAVPTRFPDSPLIPPPADAASPPSRALAIVGDPGPEPRSAQELVGWWIDQCVKRPDRNTIGQVSKHIKALLEEGFEPVHIRRGLMDWHAKEVHPSILPNLVTHAANRTAPIRAAPPKPSTTDTRVLDALALAERQEAQARAGGIG